jgi:hypothetical protein
MFAFASLLLLSCLLVCNVFAFYLRFVEKMFVFIVLKVTTQITFITSLHGGEFNTISMNAMFVLR